MQICLVFNKTLNEKLLKLLSTKNSVKTFDFNNESSGYLDMTSTNIKEIFETILNSDFLITNFKKESLLKKFYDFLLKFLEKSSNQKTIKWLDISVCSSSLISQLTKDSKFEFIDGSILSLTNDISQSILILSGSQQSSEIVIESGLSEIFVQAIYLLDTFSSKVYKKAFLISVAGNAMALAEAISYCNAKKLDFKKALEIIGQGAGSSVFLHLFGDLAISKLFEPADLSISTLIDEYEILINESNVNLNVVNCFKECLEELKDKNLGIESIIEYYVNKGRNDI